ncbi:MAG: hypothetical protein AB7P20_28570 [Rhizobiaceae bacterium]
MSLLAAIVVAVPVMLAGDKDFFNLPDDYEVRVQKVARADHETNWPFSVDHGLLACVWGLGQRLTYFVEDLGEAADEPDANPRILVLTTNPFDLVFTNMAFRDLFVPNQTIEQRIGAVAPLVTVALRLCDQPPGSVIGPAEL